MSPPSFESLVLNAGFGIFVCSSDGRLVDANPAFARMLGFATADELLVSSLDAAFGLDGAGGTAREPATSSEDDLAWIERRWHRRDGTPITLRIALRTVRDGDGTIERYEGIAEDVTAARRQEELVRRDERLASIGGTLAGVAHELNNPLAAIMGFAQWLSKKPWPDEDRMALETIAHEAERAARIVRDLLTIARQREVDRRLPVNLNDVVGYIVGTRRHALQSAGISYDVALDPTLPPVCGDRAQLEQVVLNLVNNAEQALATRGAQDEGANAPPRVSIATRSEGASVVLEVSDNGPGIPESAREHIWDPFWTTRGDGGGTGLGLSVVHHLVVEHRGTVDVDSPSDGASGASFHVRLPAMEGRAPGGDETASRALDVLVLAIDPTDRAFLLRFLTSRGHVVLSTGDLERARRLAEQTTFDAVVLDLGLAAAEREALDRLRATPGGHRARFVVSSATNRAPVEAPSRVVQSTNEIVLTKPFDVELLRRAVEEG